MAIPALIGAAIGATAISTIAGFLGSRKASKSAKKQAALEAELENKLTAERIRELGIQERVQYGETIAGYAGGGVMAKTPGLDPSRQTDQYGSPQQVIQEATQEFARERQFTKEVGASNVMQIKQRGKATSDAYKYKGYADVASGVSRILQLFG